MSRRPALAPSLLTLGLLLWTADAIAETTWTAFTPSDGSFRIDMPGPPDITTRVSGLAISRFVSTVHKAHRGHDAFGVNHTDIPKPILFMVPDKTILDAARKGFLESSEANQISFELSELDGRPAWALAYAIPARAERPEQTGAARLLFVDNRLFIFYSEIGPENAEKEDDRYFKSIRIPAP